MLDVSEIDIDISVEEEEPEMKLYEYELVPVGKYEETANKKKSLSDVKDLDNEYLSAGGVKKAIEDVVNDVNETVRVTLSINNAFSFVADITASEVYQLYQDGKDVVVIDPNVYRSGYDPVIVENPDGTTMETMFKTECIYRLDSVQGDIIMFTRPQLDEPMIIEYVKAYISTNMWTKGSYKADVYNKSEVDDKIGDIDTMLDELHNYAQGLISGGDG